MGSDGERVIATYHSHASTFGTTSGYKNTLHRIFVLFSPLVLFRCYLLPRPCLLAEAILSSSTAQMEVATKCLHRAGNVSHLFIYSFIRLSSSFSLGRYQS